MSTKPVNNPEFWKQRLDHAGGDIRNSVYVTSSDDWEVIDQQHKEFVERYVKPDQSLLDAGCGFGRAAYFLPGNYTGIDFSLQFIQEAHARNPGKKFVVGDLNKMPFINKEFDWAVCISIQGMIEREIGEDAWLAILHELKRVTVNGILILEYGNRSGTTDNHVIYNSWNY